MGRPHGVRGEVSVQPLSDEPTLRFAPGATFSTSNGQLTCVTVRTHNDRLLLTFAEVPDRTAAEALNGVLLSQDVDPNEDPGEDDAWFDHQLVGMAVVVDGEQVGEITRVDHGSAQDLLVVTNAAGRSALVPFVRAIVPSVDEQARIVVLTPPGGLLDDLAAPDEPDRGPSTPGPNTPGPNTPEADGA